jgi:hypothetical protein
MYAFEIIWERSEIFGRRRRERWLRFTVLLEIFLSLACSDIAHNRSPFTIKEPFWACKLTTKDKAAICMTKYEWTLSCVAITQPCLWLWERSQAGSVSATQWSQKPKKYADVSAHLEESVLWTPQKISKMICRFSEFKKLHVTCNKKEGYCQHWPTFNEFSVNDTDV